MLFTEKKIENVAFSQIKLSELEKGDSIMFYVGMFVDRNSQDYGDFKVVEGLKLDKDSASVKQLIASAEGASFIPNTLILNMIEEKKFRDGVLYRIEKAWNKDDKFSSGKKAKGYGYTVYELTTNGEITKPLRDKFLELKSGQENEPNPFDDGEEL